jgi:hypothetical protein
MMDALVFAVYFLEQITYKPFKPKINEKMSVWVDAMGYISLFVYAYVFKSDVSS